MKDQLFTLTFLCLLVFAGTQLTAQVTNRQANMSRGTNDALILELPSASEKLVEDVWEDYLKDNFDVKTKKVKKGKGELASLNFRIPGVSTGSKVDMYSKIDGSGESSQVMVWIATPDGYVSPRLNGSQYIEAEKMLMRFALAVSRKQIEMEIEDEEDNLKDMEKDLKDLRKDEEDAYEEIEKAKRAIAEAEATIEQAKMDQENKQLEIEEQNRKIEMTKQRLRDF